MSLEFSGRQAIKFGNLAVYPEGTTELRLRLQNISLNTDSDVSDAIEVLSSFFPSNKAEVKTFMQNEMETYELNKLRIYLISGEDGVKAVESSLQSELTRIMKEGSSV